MPSGCCCPSTWCCPPAAACGCAAAGCCCPSACSMVFLPKIEDCEDEHPHQIDEVPVQTHGFDDLVATFPAGHETRPHAIQVTAQHLDRHDDQENHADRHVRAVETRDHEKARAELSRAHGVAPGTYALVHDQLGPLESLHAHECGAQCRREQQEDKCFDTLFSIAEVHGQDHGPAAADQDEGHDRDQDQRDALAPDRQGENLAGVGPGNGGGYSHR